MGLSEKIIEDMFLFTYSHKKWGKVNKLNFDQRATHHIEIPQWIQFHLLFDYL